MATRLEQQKAAELVAAQKSAEQAAAASGAIVVPSSSKFDRPPKSGPKWAQLAAIYGGSWTGMTSHASPEFQDLKREY